VSYAFVQYALVTDRQTDGQTDGRTTIADTALSWRRTVNMLIRPTFFRTRRVFLNMLLLSLFATSYANFSHRIIIKLPAITKQVATVMVASAAKGRMFYAMLTGLVTVLKVPQI